MPKRRQQQVQYAFGSVAESEVGGKVPGVVITRNAKAFFVPYTGSMAGEEIPYRQGTNIADLQDLLYEADNPEGGAPKRTGDMSAMKVAQPRPDSTMDKGSLAALMTRYGGGGGG